MTAILRYLVIIQPTGLPLFAQSFDFTSDQACENFNHKLDRDSEKKEMLGGMFQALTGLAYEVIEDNLQQIKLEFDTYRIIAVLVNNFLILGIFENDGVDKKIEAENSVELLNNIATAFLKKYPEELIQAIPVMPEHFVDFTEEIAQLNSPIASQNCRNCLTRCKDHKKGCFPHMLYFEKTTAHPSSA